MFSYTSVSTRSNVLRAYVADKDIYIQIYVHTYIYTLGPFSYAPHASMRRPPTAHCRLQHNEKYNKKKKKQHHAPARPKLSENI